MMFERLARGQQGEGLARKFLEAKGYRLLEQGFRSRVGEIDLIMRDGDTIVFIEVKTRTSRVFGAPEEAVDGRKQRKIALAAMSFVQSRAFQDCPMRFDVVAVENGACRHFENAFSSAF